MKKLTLLSLVTLLALGAFANYSKAGIQPSPFKPEINQLGAVENGLNSCLDRVNKVLVVPPDDQEPSPNVNGAVNRLQAMDDQLFLLDALTESVVSEVLGAPPDDQHNHGDILPPLYDIKDVSQGIADTINAFLSVPPDPIHPDFLEALLTVSGSAQGFAVNTQDYIDIIETSVGCQLAPDIVSETECISYPNSNCEWIKEGPTEPYCCCVP